MPKWDKTQRPPRNVCPQEYCFCWVPPGGRADLTGRTYPTFEEAVKDDGHWADFPDGGCRAASYGPCVRAGVENAPDMYEPNEPLLEKHGLPWFYFSTAEGLVDEFREQYLEEAARLWGESES